MTLIVHGRCKDGVVVCSDGRTSSYDSDGKLLNHYDNSIKTVVFCNDIVVSMCGSALIDGVDIYDMVCKLRDQLSITADIRFLPTLLLDLIPFGYDVIFLVTGKVNNGFKTYKVKTSSREIIMDYDLNSYGVSYNGSGIHLAHPMFNRFEYNNMSIKDLLNLCKFVMDVNSKYSNYYLSYGVGGDVIYYVIDLKSNSSGWVPNGNLDPFTLVSDSDVSCLEEPLILDTSELDYEPVFDEPKLRNFDNDFKVEDFERNHLLSEAFDRVVDTDVLAYPELEALSLHMTLPEFMREMRKIDKLRGNNDLDKLIVYIAKKRKWSVKKFRERYCFGDKSRIVNAFKRLNEKLPKYYRSIP